MCKCHERMTRLKSCAADKAADNQSTSAAERFFARQNSFFFFPPTDLDCPVPFWECSDISCQHKEGGLLSSRDDAVPKCLPGRPYVSIDTRNIFLFLASSGVCGCLAAVSATAHTHTHPRIRPCVRCKCVHTTTRGRYIHLGVLESHTPPRAPLHIQLRLSMCDVLRNEHG